jgi:nonsense-mediated mRNA decay protein 3
MFCPKCGCKDVVDVFCKECLREEKPLVESFKPFEVKVCTASKRIFFKGTWQETRNPDKKIGEFLAEHVVPTQFVEIEKIEVEPIHIEFKDGLKQEGDAHVIVTGRASKKANVYQEEYDFPYVIENTLSPKFRKHDQYFEGTLQVRNEHEYAIRFLKEYIGQHGASIAKMTQHKNGTDYYLSSKQVIERAAYELQARFGGTIKTSAQLFGRDKQRSKDVYRVTFLIELPFFIEGDVVAIEKDVLLCLEMGKRIKFYSLKRGRVIYYEYKDHRWEQLPIHETTISSIEPDMMVLDPETFQPAKVWNMKKEAHEIDDRVDVVNNGRKLYLVEQI